ncbi:MAG: MaoC family dehydratase [Erysipelotrichaceae bacterium]|jgi:3-hydroxybutyryl-CoA dehydratase|nr:MaoC family dehydratase [Erysipelotrichaceae bacterium]
MLKGISIQDLKLGQSSSFTKQITNKDVLLFAEVSGDDNPVHVNEEFAQTTMFKGRIVHGALVASLFSKVLGTQLPGMGTIYLGQESRFMKPVRIDETITATVTIIEIIAEKNRVILETIARNSAGEIVVSGKATVLAPKEEA